MDPFARYVIRNNDNNDNNNSNNNNDKNNPFKVVFSENLIHIEISKGTFKRKTRQNNDRTLTESKRADQVTKATSNVDAIKHETLSATRQKVHKA